MTRLIRAVVWSVVVASVGYFVAVVLAGTDDIVAHIARVPAAGLALILALSLLNYALRFVRWHWYVARLGKRMPPGWHALYYLAGMSLTTTPAKAGELLRSVYLKNHGVAYSGSIAALVAERTTDVAAVVILAAFALTQFPQLVPWVLGALAAAATVIAALRAPRLARALARRCDGLPAGRLRTAAARARELLGAAAALSSPRMFAVAVLIALASWGAEAYAFHLICAYLSIDVPFATAVSIYASSILIGAASFLPGGLGTAEAAMGGLLLAAGAAPESAVAATLLCRVTTLWFGVGIGLAVMSGLELAGRGVLLSGSATLKV